MTTIQRSVSPSSPTKEPLSLSEAKEHLGIADAETGHDRHVSSLIIASREQWEHDTQSLTTSRTVVENLDNWPDEDWRFYYRPIVSLTSIQYYDSGNSQQTLASSVYSLDTPNRKIHLQVDQTYPAAYSRWDSITVTYVAGESTVKEIVKSAMKLQLDLLFELRGMTKDKDKVTQAYENLVKRYMRSSYP